MVDMTETEKMLAVALWHALRSRPEGYYAVSVSSGPDTIKYEVIYPALTGDQLPEGWRPATQVEA